MTNSYTTAHIAAYYDITPRRVLAMAKARGVKPVCRYGRFCMWATSSLRKLKPGKPGRPRHAPPGRGGKEKA